MEVGDNEIQTCINVLVITNRKQNKELMLFATFSGTPACCIPPNGDTNVISKPSQKFLS